MWHFLVDVIVPALITAVIGVFVWIATNFFADPLVKFYRRRTEVHETLYFTLNVGDHSEKAEKENAMCELRRHAAALDAIWETSPKPIRFLFRILGFDVKGAAAGLTGYSNSITLEEGSRAISRDRVETGLGFVRSYTREELIGIRKQNAHRMSVR